MPHVIKTFERSASYTCH